MSALSTRAETRRAVGASGRSALPIQRDEPSPWPHPNWTRRARRRRTIGPSRWTRRSPRAPRELGAPPRAHDTIHVTVPRRAAAARPAARARAGDRARGARPTRASRRGGSNAPACRVQICCGGQARAAAALPENGVHAPPTRASPPGGKEATCFEQMLALPVTNRRARARRTFEPCEHAARVRDDPRASCSPAGHSTRGPKVARAIGRLLPPSAVPRPSAGTRPGPVRAPRARPSRARNKLSKGTSSATRAPGHTATRPRGARRRR